MRSYLFGFLLLFFALDLFAQAETDSAKYWRKGRTYVYRAIYTDSIGDTLSNEIIRIQATGEKWSIDPKQTLATFTMGFSSSDSASLAPFPPNGVQRGWYREYQEGVIETRSSVWMHPVRMNQYQLTEIAPFPCVHLPMDTSQKWTNQLMIYEGFGTFAGIVNTSYQTVGREMRIYPFGVYDCWKTEAIGEHNTFGFNTAVFYFEENIGFTEMFYWFYNGRKLEFRLIEYSG
jgi:hypothetical protein